jgi:hypothetical protein
VDPADAEADPVGAQAIGQRQQPHLAASGCGETVQLEAVVKALDDRFLRTRFRQRGVQVSLEVVDGLEAEDPTLTARVGGLEHGGEADGLGGRMRPVEIAHRREPGLRHPALGEATPHCDLVGHHVCRLGADPRQPERLGHRGHDRDSSVGRDRDHAGSAVTATERDQCLDVTDVVGLRDVRFA